LWRRAFAVDLGIHERTVARYASGDIKTIPPAIRTALRCIPGLFCVTDSTAAAGMPDGEYRLGEHRVQKCLGGVRLELARPVFTTPQFGWSALVSLGIPLFVVTMASQNLPGVAAIRAAGYGGANGIPVSRVITITGVATLLLAPFGGYALNLSAITAAICMGREAHEDARKQAERLAEEKMKAVTAGLPVPPGMKLPF
jgi:hypothetical protein